jgi:hypothetical protein
VTYARIARDYRSYAVLAAAALAVSGIAVGARGLAGMVIGLTSALFGVFILWQLICVIGKAVTEGGSPALGTGLTIFGFFLKLPILGFAYIAARAIGHGALGCFLAGLMLVYFAVVAWAIARH